jgi:hypothetical protein
MTWEGSMGGLAPLSASWVTLQTTLLRFSTLLLSRENMTFLLVAPHSVVEDEINAQLAKPHRTARHGGALPELRPSRPSRPAASFTVLLI